MGWGKSTQLGYGLGITMGAKLAEPKKLCVNVMGDAAIGMTGMDIETAARNRIGILTVVFNNGVMARRARRAEDLRREVRLDDGQRQLHQGRRGPERGGDARREAGRYRVGRSRRRCGVTGTGAPFLLEFVVKEGPRLLALQSGWTVERRTPLCPGVSFAGSARCFFKGNWRALALPLSSSNAPGGLPQAPGHAA